MPSTRKSTRQSATKAAAETAVQTVAKAAATPRRASSFNQGATPTIAVFNKAKTPLGVDLDKLIKALQVYVDKHVVPVWGTPAKLVKTTDFQPGAWAIVFLDDADSPGALAYHDLTPDGLPQSKVFVKTTVDAGELVSVSTSHELVEMLVDPAINLMTTGPDAKAVYAYESADPVESETFPVNGIPMSDFVYPAYFEAFHAPGSVKFDHLGKVSKPFEVLKGGYQIVFKGGKWSQTYGSKGKAKSFALEDRRGHRSEQRAQGQLKAADAGKIAKAEAKGQAKVAPAGKVSAAQARLLETVAGG